MTQQNSNESTTRPDEEHDTGTDDIRPPAPVPNSRPAERSDEPYREAARESSSDDEPKDDMDDSNLHVFRDSDGMPMRIMTEKAYQLSMQNRGSR